MEPLINLYSYQARYGMRLQRLTVDGGFTCPNRDGMVGTGGCTFCDNDAFHPGDTHGKSITGQLETGVAFHRKRARKADGHLAYFQPFSNTYADLDALARRYEEALSFPGVRGLVVGTRPDCIDVDKLQLLASGGGVLLGGLPALVSNTLIISYLLKILGANRAEDYAVSC